LIALTSLPLVSRAIGLRMPDGLELPNGGRALFSIARRLAASTVAFDPAVRSFEG